MISSGKDVNIDYIKGGLIEKKPIKRKSLAYQKAEALFTKFDTGVVSVNGKSVAYI